MKCKIKLKINILLFLLLVILVCANSFAKEFDINGITISISNEVTKKKVYKNTDTLYTGDTLESNSNLWEEKDDKVKIKISIQNINPYETLKVNIKEDISPYFKITDGNINNGVENISILSGTKQDTNYEYKYQKTIFMQDVDHIVYSDDIRIDESDNDIRFEETNRDIYINSDNTDIRLNDNNENIEFEDTHMDVKLEEYIKENNIKIPEGVRDRYRYVNKIVFGSETNSEIDEEIERGIEYKENDKNNNLSGRIVNKSSISDISRNISFYDEKIDSKLENNIKIVLIVVVIFVICLVVLFIFYVFTRSYQNKDIDFEKYVGQVIIIIALSMLLNIGNKVVALDYTPYIYEYGKTYEKTIYTVVKYDEKYYRFNYIVTLEYTHNNFIDDYETDTDGDMLVDALEYKYMTDNTKVDTDGDGLSDYIEVMILNYNPNKKDTFNDGIRDENRDFDGDKLTNIKEVQLGTDLSNIDTDFDTLTDYDEVKVYNTNPLKIDTDEDLLSDFDELKLGLNPNNPRTDGVNLDSERKIEQQYNMMQVPNELKEGDVFIKSIRGSVSGNIDNEVKVTKKNEEIFNSMSSFVQSGFKIELKEDEKIDIELDVSKVSERKTAMIVVRYENGNIEPIDTVCEGNSLKPSVGNGTYTVMDSEIVLRDLSIFVNDYMP